MRVGVVVTTLDNRVPFLVHHSPCVQMKTREREREREMDPFVEAAAAKKKQKVSEKAEGRTTPLFFFFVQADVASPRRPRCLRGVGETAKNKKPMVAGKKKKE